MSEPTTESKIPVAVTVLVGALKYVAGMINGHYNLVTRNEVRELMSLPGASDWLVVERDADLNGVTGNFVRHAIRDVSGNPELYRLWAKEEYKAVVAACGLQRTRMLAALEADKQAAIEKTALAEEAARVKAETELVKLAEVIAEFKGQTVDVALSELRAMPKEKISVLAATLLAMDE